jgi:hypothetical protein
MPSLLLIAVGVWWVANTVAHNFIHQPFFRARAANTAFSLYLSLLLAVPQTLWRDRHLAHHADRPWRWRSSSRLAAELAVVGMLWTAIAWSSADLFLRVWVPGWLGGMILCHLQGRFEHSRGTVSHYGRFYNLLFFNDGYHVEHHAHPARHWSALPGAGRSDSAPSTWPAVMRWLERLNLDALERLVFRSRLLQGFVLCKHRAALRRLLACIPPAGRVTVVGGGLFPRTALLLRELAPDAEVTIVDRSAEHLTIARPFLDGRIRVQHATVPPFPIDADLVVIPLAFRGDREALYADPPAPVVAIHDWIWRRRGEGWIVSPFLLKRVNVVRR